MYRQQDQDNKGEEVLRAGIAAIPNEANLHYALGLLLVRDKRMRKSTEYLQRAAELVPERTHYAYVYALALQQLGEVEMAIQILENVLKRDSRNREAHLALAKLYRDRGDVETARRRASVLREQNPNDPEVEALWRQLQ